MCRCGGFVCPVRQAPAAGPTPKPLGEYMGHVTGGFLGDTFLQP